ncbi:hypothetical protein ACHHYP_02546 [Achlya hypogyna]|uniref:WW domain-containing protein n=1 Tax=Achlya hypogyna TaxID=1202772 RepID=A0A1V9Z5X9_ACHHY|nr:hypothetical protein ACHHYP_02546 [Achlya hypogyna]
MDVSELRTKYPWLQLTDAAVRDFNAPFVWGKPDRRPRAQAREAGRKMLLAAARDAATDAVVLKQLPRRAPPPTADSLDAIVHQSKQLVKAPPWQAPVVPAPKWKHAPARQKTRPQVSKAIALEVALHVAQDDESALRERLEKEVEAQRATLPLTFLFERNMTEYCKEKGIETIVSVFAKLQNKWLFEGLRRWKLHTAGRRHAETQQKVQAQMQARALQMFNRVAGGCLLGNIRTAFQRWTTATRALVTAERHSAAIRIQVHVKRRRDMALLGRLKAAREAQRARDAALLQELLSLEALGYAQLWQIRRQVDMIKERQELEAQLRTRSATAIQSRYRGYRGRCYARVFRRQRQEDALRRAAEERAYFARIHAAAIVLQREVRRYLAKLALYDRRMQARIRHDNALMIQHAWRTSKGQKVLATRFARRQLTLAEQAERERYLARQRLIAELEARRQAAATTIQRRARGMLGRRKAALRKYEVALEAAARRVQASWRKSTGRFALHLRFLAQRERLAARRTAAALCIQTTVRRWLAAQRVAVLRQARQDRRDEEARVRAHEALRERSATLLQRVFRGHIVRRGLRRMHAAATSIECMVRQHQARATRRAKEAARQELRARQHAAAVEIQRVARGRLGRQKARAVAEARRLEAEKRQLSASRIQSRLRGNQSRTAMRTLHCARQVVLQQQGRTLSKGLSPLARLVTTLPSTSLAFAHVAALESAIVDAKAVMQAEDRAATRIQCLYRGRHGRFAYHLLLEAKHRRDLLEAACATQIQRRVRGRIGRAKVAKVRARRQRHEAALAYKRSLAAQEAKQKWLIDVDMEKFRAEVERERANEHALLIARQEAELARLTAEALDARRRVEEANKQRAEETANAWDEITDSYGYVYYTNRVTGQTSWDVPAELLKKRAAATAEAAPKPAPAKDEWEELYNPNTGQMYFHNRATGETKWTPSDEAPPATPDVHKDPPLAVADAPQPADPAPAVEAAPHVDAPKAFSTMCWSCKKRPAIRQCVGCTAPTRDYCTVCFAKEHRAATKRDHDFKLLAPDGTREWALCCGCGGKATHYCAECDPGTRYLCEKCFPQRHETAASLSHQSLHFSSSASLCAHCSGERLVAQVLCHECLDKFCPACYETLHASSKKKQHPYARLNVLKADLGEEETYCVACDVVVATRLCNLCGDSYCDACYDAAHAKGRKAEHTFILCKDAATAGDWVEIFDSNRKGHLYYNLVTKETVEEKPSVLLLGLDRHRDMIAENLRDKKKREVERESEVVALRESVRALQEEKELERRYREQQAILQDNPDVLQTKPRKRWWQSKAQLEKERKQREDNVVLSLMMTQARKQKLHQEAMEIGSASYATAILDSVIPAVTDKS